MRTFGSIFLSIELIILIHIQRKYPFKNVVGGYSSKNAEDIIVRQEGYTMKKTNRLAVMIGVLLLLVTVTTAVPAFAATSGGWTVSKASYSFLTSGQKKIFNKAVKGLTGVTYKPVALIAKQVVEGTNYVFLCQGTTATKKPVRGWYVLSANKNLKKKVSLLSVKKIKLTNIKTGKNPRTGITAGGLQIASVKNKSAALAKDVCKVFLKATKTYTGYELRPIALLGKQVVAGANYRILCYGKNHASADLFVLEIYQNAKGKCCITSSNPLKLEKYVG